eukprot:SAG22_NODE_10876_length_512_cov_0.888620_1_plen_37_part_10
MLADRRNGRDDVLLFSNPRSRTGRVNGTVYYSGLPRS